MRLSQGEGWGGKDDLARMDRICLPINPTVTLTIPLLLIATHSNMFISLSVTCWEGLEIVDNVYAANLSVVCMLHVQPRISQLKV